MKEQKNNGRRLSFFRTRKGKTVFFIFSALLLPLLMLFSLCCGIYELSVPDALQALCGANDGNAAWQIVRNIRLPRILLGALTGAVFAVSGAILQGVLRNPLASPGILGVSSGGGLAVILLILVFPSLYVFAVPAAFAGAFLTALLVYLLAWKQGVDPVRLILAGIAVSAMLGAFSGMILILHPDRAGSVLDFSIGSLSMKSWSHLRQVAPWGLGALAAAMFCGTRLNILELGDETAASLGLSVERTRRLLLAAAALLAADGVSAAGLLGFAGLIAPHTVRLIIGPDNRTLLPASALAGAILVVLCDTAARLFSQTQELPAGTLLALLGPPFFLYLLKKERHHAL